MIRLLTALALLLALSLPAAAQGCGPTNPNCVVPTRPVGTCDNTAASTQFVCNGGGGGGGGGAAITRAAIPATNTGGTPSLTLTGFATPGDRGSGAPYTCAGQTSASIGAIQDSAGTWCAFDVSRVAAMDGWQDGWFGGKADGVTDDTAAIQASYDAGFNSGLANSFCTTSAAARLTSYPLYYDPPGSMRGGAAWTPQFVFNTTGGYPSGSIIASSNTSTNGILYANNGSTLAWSNPTSPDSTGYGMDLAYQIVSSTASVTYSPSWSPALLNNAAVVASFKGSGAIGTPTVLGVANAQTSPNSFATTVSAPASSLIIVAIADSAAAGVTTVTDNATGGSNTYSNAVSVDNGTLGGIYIFYSTTGHALPASNTAITVSGASPTIYQAIVVSVANASAGLDKTAFVDNTSNAINNPSVSTGVLAQTNEIIFGALFSNSERISTNFVESPGFTFTTPNKWSLAGWNSGTTYNAGDHVMYPPANPIPWQSLQSGNMNHIPLSDVGANFLPVWWQPITLTPSRNALSDGAYLHGSLTYTPGSNKHGCIIQTTFNNSFGLAMVPGNGVALTNFEINGPTGATRCGQPTTGIGIVEFGASGGSNRVVYTNVGVTNFYYNFLFGTGSAQNPAAGGPGLGAENHLFTPGSSNGCYAAYITGTQSFINSITDASFTDNNTAVFTPATVGVKISGGNYSHENGPFPAAKFAMSGVSASFTTNIGYSFTATLATPGDPYMTKTCADVISPSNLPVWPNVRCNTDVYNTFELDLRPAGYGIVPFVMTAFNRSTGVATFYTLYSWFTGYGGQCCGAGLTTAINAQTTVWAAEMTRKFVGENLNVDSIHIEDTAPFQLVDTNSQFAPGAPTTLRHIIFNADYTNCNGYTPGNAATEANCFAQQEFPFINMGLGDLIIDNVISTVIGGISSETNMVDFQPNPISGSGGHLTVRGWEFGQFNYRIQPFTEASNSFNQGNQGNFSGNYQTYGSAAFGQGDFEMAPMTGNQQAVSGPQQGGWTENAWLTRTQGLGRSPFYGTRPAPWSTPCISPLELVKASTFLPAIFVDANNQWQVNYALLSSGQQYKICDWNLTPTAWSNGANYYPGSLVTNAGTIYVSLAGDANQVANRNETPGSPQSFTASIAGSTMTVTVAAAGTVIVHAPITSGAAAGTTIIQQLSGTLGGVGTYQVEPSQTVASGTLTATYWASLGATLHYGAISNHFAGYSYGQNLTTAINAGLGWSITNNSPFMQITGGRNGLYFPGLVLGLAGTQAGCTTQENFVIRGVHGLLGYLDLFLLDSDVNGNIVPAFGAALCSNSVINQAPYSVTNLN